MGQKQNTKGEKTKPATIDTIFFSPVFFFLVGEFWALASKSQRTVTMPSHSHTHTRRHTERERQSDSRGRQKRPEIGESTRRQATQSRSFIFIAFLAVAAAVPKRFDPIRFICLGCLGCLAASFAQHGNKLDGKILKIMPAGLSLK